MSKIHGYFEYIKSGTADLYTAILLPIISLI